MRGKTTVNRRAKGAAYETLAAKYLESLGYDILARNYYGRRGELDLIAQEGGILVFIEIKYRKNGTAGQPWEAVDKRKQFRMVNTAKEYMMEKHLSMQTPCRFDVVSILGREITLYKNAFGEA